MFSPLDSTVSVIRHAHKRERARWRPAVPWWWEQGATAHDEDCGESRALASAGPLASEVR